MMPFSLNKYMATIVIVIAIVIVILLVEINVNNIQQH